MQIFRERQQPIRTARTRREYLSSVLLPGTAFRCRDLEGQGGLGLRLRLSPGLRCLADGITQAGMGRLTDASEEWLLGGRQYLRDDPGRSGASKSLIQLQG